MKLLKDVLNANIILITVIKFKKKRKSSVPSRTSVSLTKRNEKKRNKKFMRNYLKKLSRKIIVKIQANNELNVFVNEMSNEFSKMLKIRSCSNTLFIRKMLIL